MEAIIDDLWVLYSLILCCPEQWRDNAGPGVLARPLGATSYGAP